MLIFDIPYHAQNDGTWAVDKPGGARRAFHSRHDAVRFAAKEASGMSGRRNETALLSIEGDDGRWRLFGPDLKAPVKRF